MWRDKSELEYYWDVVVGVTNHHKIIAHYHIRSTSQLFQGFSELSSLALLCVGETGVEMVFPPLLAAIKGKLINYNFTAIIALWRHPCCLIQQDLWNWNIFNINYSPATFEFNEGRTKGRSCPSYHLVNVFSCESNSGNDRPWSLSHLEYSNLTYTHYFAATDHLILLSCEIWCDELPPKLLVV